MSIVVLTTGGTIGCLPHPDPRNPPPIVPMPPDGRDIVREYLHDQFKSFNARCLSLEPRDSKFIDDAYLTGALSFIESAPESKILMTFGTDDMLRCVGFLYHKMTHDPASTGKTLIASGSMIPLANGPEADGYRNMAYALECLCNNACGNSRVNIVLSDFNDAGEWVPRLYPFQPDLYEKFYDKDQRYNRLRLKS